MKQAEDPLLIDVAPQGGGSHGAIEAISGTSAGAMNAKRGVIRNERSRSTAWGAKD
jgi:hypothetical protein